MMPDMTDFHVKEWNEARRKTAMHMLVQAVKIGCSETGTDVAVEGSSVFGSFWWPIVRDAVLERDDRHCRICGNMNDLHVHHILPRHCGGADNPVNLITLCADCHMAAHRNRRTEYRTDEIQTRLDSFRIRGDI
jgi:hypothetical protein